MALPFVAFCLSQGLAQTRETATQRRVTFNAWLEEELDEPEAEDRIDPQYFQQWQSSLRREEAAATAQESYGAELTGTDGRNRRYAVIPVSDGDNTRWLDPAGFELAFSKADGPDGRRLFRSDFELRTAGKRAGVIRAFRPA